MFSPKTPISDLLRREGLVFEEAELDNGTLLGYTPPTLPLKTKNRELWSLDDLFSDYLIIFRLINVTDYLHQKTNNCVIIFGK